MALLVYVDPFNMIWVGLVLFRASKNKLRLVYEVQNIKINNLVDDLFIMPFFLVYDPRIISTYMLQAEKKARLIIFLINVIYLAPYRFLYLIRLYELQEIGILV